MRIDTHPATHSSISHCDFSTQTKRSATTGRIIIATYNLSWFGGSRWNRPGHARRVHAYEWNCINNCNDTDTVLFDCKIYLYASSGECGLFFFAERKKNVVPRTCMVPAGCLVWLAVATSASAVALCAAFLPVSWLLRSALVHGAHATHKLISLILSIAIGWAINISAVGAAVAFIRCLSTIVWPINKQRKNFLRSLLYPRLHTAYATTANTLRCAIIHYEFISFAFKKKKKRGKQLLKSL